MKAKGNLTRRIATVAILTAMSLITFLIENLLPPLFIPGAKLGLANAFSFAALVMFGPVESFTIVAARTVLGAVFAGNLSALMYSFTGGMISMAVGALAIYLVHPAVSLVAISALCAAVHNLVQNAVFALISRTPLAFSYAPYLLIIGVISGAAVGAIITLVFKRVPLSVFERAALSPSKDLTPPAA